MKRLFLVLTLLVLTPYLMSCSGKDDSKGDTYNLTCKIDGVAKTFVGGKFGLDNYDSTFNNFYNDPDNDVSHIYFKFPGNVAPGTYSSTDSMCDYRDAAGSDYYSEKTGATLTITITEWGTDDGSPIKGTFSGKLLNINGDAIEITEGTFESSLVVH